MLKGANNRPLQCQAQTTHVVRKRETGRNHRSNGKRILLCMNPDNMHLKVDVAVVRIMVAEEESIGIGEAGATATKESFGVPTIEIATTGADSHLLRDHQCMMTLGAAGEVGVGTEVVEDRLFRRMQRMICTGMDLLVEKCVMNSFAAVAECRHPVGFEVVVVAAAAAADHRHLEIVLVHMVQ